MIGLSLVNRLSKSLSERPCGCSRGGHEPVEVHHVDEADLEIGEVLTQQHHRRQRLLGGNVAGTGHHHVRLRPLVVARLPPDADALGAMRDGLVHGHVLQVLLLVADDHVDVVGALEAMIGDAEQGIHIRRQVDAANIRALVHHQVEEARILVGEAVVILPPHGGGDQQVERGHRRTPRLAPQQIASHLACMLNMESMTWTKAS